MICGARGKAHNGWELECQREAGHEGKHADGVFQWGDPERISVSEAIKRYGGNGGVSVERMRREGWELLDGGAGFERVKP